MTEKGKTIFTAKKQRFADEYLISLNATKAYMKAYRCKNEITARVNGSKLLTDTNVALYIADKQRKLQEKTEITQEKIINELAKIAFADVTQFLKYKNKRVKVGINDKTGKPIFDQRLVIEMINSGKVDTSAIEEISITESGTLKFKLHDKKGALVDLGKHIGMFPNKVVVGGDKDNPLKVNNVNINVDDKTLIDMLDEAKRELEDWKNKNIN